MDLQQIGIELTRRRKALSLSLADTAQRAGCTPEEAEGVFAGHPSTPAACLLAVAKALGYVLVTVPAPAERAVAAGSEVTEPKIETVISKALKSLRPRTVLFLDLDGPMHPVGASRIDDRGQLVGEGLFRWWPELAVILEDFPLVDIVIHSSWRRFWPSLEYLRPLLPEDLAERVVGLTSSDIPGRYDSITRYISEHGVRSYVIVDDQEFEFEPGCKNLVLCDAQSGLGDPGAQQQLRRALTQAGICTSIPQPSHPVGWP